MTRQRSNTFGLVANRTTVQLPLDKASINTSIDQSASLLLHSPCSLQYFPALELAIIESDAVFTSLDPAGSSRSRLVQEASRHLVVLWQPRLTDLLFPILEAKLGDNAANVAGSEAVETCALVNQMFLRHLIKAFSKSASTSGAESNLAITDTTASNPFSSSATEYFPTLLQLLTADHLVGLR